MGVQRGDFEKVLATTEGPRAARISTDVADVGAPLRLLAPALGSWANVFGHLAKMGTDYTRRKNESQREMYEAKADSVDANVELAKVERRGRDFSDYDERLRNGTLTNADRTAYEAWQAERDAAQVRANKMASRSKLAEDRWRRTGFFGWEGTPDIAMRGKGL